MDMAVDTLDIQARLMLPTLLDLALSGKSLLNEDEEFHVGVARAVFSKWDYRFSKESNSASMYAAWEYMIATYLHEMKIEGVTARRNFGYTFMGEHFLNRQAQEWQKAGKPVYEEWC